MNSKKRHNGKLQIVELDAFPAIILYIFKQMISDSMGKYFDQAIYEENLLGDIESNSEDDIKKLIRKHVIRLLLNGFE